MTRSTRWQFCAATLALIALSTSSAFAQREGPDVEAILEELTVELELTEEQTQQVGGILSESAQKLDEATAEAEEEEPDPQAMLSEVKKVRADFQNQMEAALTPEQWEAYQALVDAVLQEIFESLAELKITDLTPVLDLTDDQAMALKPVMGSSMRALVAVLVEYGDRRMGVRTKLRVANALKKIQADMKAGMGEILTPEQMEAYEAYKAAQKEAKEG